MELYCENCGNLIQKQIKHLQEGKKYFCSKSCSTTYYNKRRNFTKEKREEINQKLSQKLKLIHPPKIRYCAICGKEYFDRTRKTCSKECEKILRDKHQNGGSGGYRKGASRGKHGYYKGIYCDSTFELAYLIYCLDHNINIRRCEQKFEYQYEGKKHFYHPDFIVDNMIIEIKNFSSPLTDAKLKAVNKPIKIYYTNDLIPIFEYVSSTYNKKFKGKMNNFYELYDI